MGRLFWKIFLWFWLSMILITLGVAWLIAQLLDDNREQLARIARPAMVMVVSMLETKDAAVTRNFLSEMDSLQDPPMRIFVVDEQGQDLLGRQVPEPHPRHAAEPGNPDDPFLDGFFRRTVTSADGRRYRVLFVPREQGGLVDLGKPPRALSSWSPQRRDPRVFSLRIGVAVLISSLFCFWLAWYLTRPVKQLREASRRLANGELDTRVVQSIGQRRDEIADLGRDFDHMAERLQALVSTRQQLLSDISHELRSPLARLQVALGLARKKAGAGLDRELDRIERESIRLDELIGQVLTLTRLEAGSAQLPDEYIDVAVLLEEITRDVNFEMTDRNCRARLAGNTGCTLKANVELLHRALENVVRNAMRYTADNTVVDVSIERDAKSANRIRICVCDRGPGVPDNRLAELFEPFVRLSESRDRQGGGYGLGLAIARRAILLHGGTIEAVNRADGGLCVQVTLPVTDRRSLTSAR